VLHGTLGAAILIAAWAAALVEAVFKLIWIDEPGWLIATTYVSLGWVAPIATSELVDRLGIAAVGSLALGGILYSVGAVIDASRRPDPGRGDVRLRRAVSPARDPRSRGARRRRGRLRLVVDRSLAHARAGDGCSCARHCMGR
jgi:predicted membrane channel-forming protein YqfA (hemolysin III family)